MDATIINVECYVFGSKIQPKCVTAYASRSALLANAPLSLANINPSRSLTSSDAQAKLVVVELHKYASRLISELCQHGTLILVEEFNSLDSQRETCEAYIVSQRHAGWVMLPDMYDDGGLSGGTMERPALKRLLEDINTSEVQIVVVYKVDWLTRSLSDFAKIVDVLDARNASFVSVTQQLNTTTSIERLTLNMLSSFAQFECKIAGERIRDKIAASKRKGMWWSAMAVRLWSSFAETEKNLVVCRVEWHPVQ